MKASGRTIGIGLAVSLVGVMGMSLKATADDSKSDSRESIIRSIRDAIKDLCQSPNQEGEYLKVEGEGGAEVSVQLFKLLGSGNAKGKAQFSKEEWKGVRKVLDQNAENKNFRECARELTPQFIQKFSNFEIIPKRLENFAWKGGSYTGPSLDDKPSGPDGVLSFRSSNGFGREFVWSYRGNFNFGSRDGPGKMTIKVNEGPTIELSGQFENDLFLAGSGKLVFDKFNPFKIQTSTGGYHHVFGVYEGEVRNKAPERQWADGHFWRNIVANGNGTLTGRIENSDPDKEYTLIWGGAWKDNAFNGNGRVTYPDGGYEEGLFHYKMLVEGKTVASKADQTWGVRLGSYTIYSGEILNGRPHGEGRMTGDAGNFPVKLDGVFKEGKIESGYGYRPRCSEKNGCVYGDLGEFRNGELYSGSQSIPGGDGKRSYVDRYEMKDGKVLSHKTEPEP